jgi:hypothetical protein
MFKDIPGIRITRSSMQHTGCIEFGENVQQLVEERVQTLASYKDFSEFEFIDDVEGEESETESIASERSQVSQYGDDDEPSIRIISRNMAEDVEEIEFDRPDEDFRKNFENLSSTERRLLPLTHVLSSTDQYRIIANALESNFRNTLNLPKVSDDILQISADMCALAANNTRNRVAVAAELLINYADKRRV